MKAEDLAKAKAGNEVSTKIEFLEMQKGDKIRVVVLNSEEMVFGGEQTKVVTINVLNENGDSFDRRITSNSGLITALWDRNGEAFEIGYSGKMDIGGGRSKHAYIVSELKAQ